MRALRAIAAALVVMVPCASLAHGHGPGEDAPRVVQAPSARLLPTAAPLQDAAAVTAPAAPLYKSWVLWTALGAFTLAVGAVVAAMVVSMTTFAHVQHGTVQLGGGAGPPVQ